MFKHCITATLGLLALTPSAWSQTVGKENTLKEVAALVEGLTEKNSPPRQQAYLKLMAYRPLPKEIAPTLTKMLASETGDIRTTVAAVLAEVTPGDASLAKTLGDGLATKDLATAQNALKGLERLGPLAKPAFPQVLAVLDSADVNLRVAAIPVVALMGKEGVAPLEKLILKAADARKKNDQAAVALGKTGPDATPTILRLLDMDDPLLDHHAALALKSMDKKPPEAVKPMVRLAQHKDNIMRRSAYDFLIAVQPPTPAATEALWAGAEDPDNMIAVKCLNALRVRTPDKQKWVPALKKYVQRYYVGGGGLSALHELYQVDRKEAEPYLLPTAQRVLGYAQQYQTRVIQLATFEKELVPHLSKIYPLLDGPARGNAGVRRNAITLLTHLSPEHTMPVQGKLQADLKSPRWEAKLAAAKALLRLKNVDRVPLARALAEVLTVPNLPFDFRWAEVLDDLRRLGPDAKATLPTLRVAQANAKGEVRGRMLLTMAAIDPDLKTDMTAIAQRIYQGKTDQFVGAAVLLELGALDSAEALKSLGQALDGVPTQLAALRLLETLGPKAAPLATKLAAMADNPKNVYPTQTVLALGKVTGDRKAMFERLLRIGKDDRLQFSNVLRAFGQIGPDAQPVVPALFELAGDRANNLDFVDALALIDPRALNRVFD